MTKNLRKTYLITGGAGFIGSNLVNFLLDKNFNVIVLDNLSTGKKENLKKHRNLKFFKVDISKKINHRKYFTKADYVIHLAGIADIVPSIINPKKYFDSNVTGTLNILESCRQYKNIKKIIYAASASCYGVPKKFPTDEKSKIEPMYPYALTKNLGEKLAMHYFKIYKLPIISLRFFNIFGPNSRTTGAYGAMFGVFLAQKINNQPLTIVGNGNQTRDFLYVLDLCRAILKASLSTKKGEIYNVASGKEIKVNFIAKLISKNLTFIPKRPGEPDRSLASIKKIKKHLKWYPRIPIEKGVEILLNRISDWKKAPVWTPKKIKSATRLWFKLLS